MKKLVPLYSLIWVMLLCSCVLSPENEVFRTEELAIDVTLTESQSIFLMDAYGPRLLFCISDRQTGPVATTATFQSVSIFIYNSESQEVEISWEPEIVGHYQSGVLTSNSTALCGVCLDCDGYNADTVISLGSEQKIIAQIDGALDAPAHLGIGISLFPYTVFENGVAVCKVLTIEENKIIDNPKWLNHTLAISSICYAEDRVCYISEIDERSYFVVADKDGELWRSEFDPSAEKLDSFCLTPDGVLASMDVGSSHKCVLFGDDGSRIELDMPGSKSAIYRLRSNSMTALGVDYKFNLMAVNFQNGGISITENICSEITAFNTGSPISLRVSSKDTFFVFFPEKGTLYKVKTA